MPDPQETTKEQMDAEWPHICSILNVQRVPAAMAEVIRQSMTLAAVKVGVNLEALDEYERKVARRRALLDIFNCYGGKDKGA